MNGVCLQAQQSSGFKVNHSCYLWPIPEDRGVMTASMQLALLALLLSCACVTARQGSAMDEVFNAFVTEEPAPIPREVDLAYYHDEDTELCFKRAPYAPRSVTAPTTISCESQLTDSHTQSCSSFRSKDSVQQHQLRSRNHPLYIWLKQDVYTAEALPVAQHL